MTGARDTLIGSIHGLSVQGLRGFEDQEPSKRVEKRICGFSISFSAVLGWNLWVSGVVHVAGMLDLYRRNNCISVFLHEEHITRSYLK